MKNKINKLFHNFKFNYNNHNTLHKNSFFNFSTTKTTTTKISTSLIRNNIDLNNLDKLKSLPELKNTKNNAEKIKTILMDKINTTGPISIAEYMNICLYDQDYGYYTTKEHIFGDKGDFSTAPEISQLFGESLGIWVYKVLESFGFPNTYDLIEIGGGRGLLMSDVLRSLKKFNTIDGVSVYMIEKSKTLRKIQQEVIIKSLNSDRIFLQYKYDEVSVIMLFNMFMF